MDRFRKWYFMSVAVSGFFSDTYASTVMKFEEGESPKDIYDKMLSQAQDELGSKNVRVINFQKVE